MDDRDLQARTGRHYDAVPFEFLTDEDERRIEEMQPGAFLRYAESHLVAGMRVAEIGCGPGRATMFMVNRGIDVLAVDISMTSLLLARRRAPAAAFALATNVALPFPRDTFDAIISDGVIHHTPDARASLGENARILREGGSMYLGVYRRKRYYYYLYRYAGRPIRALNATMWGRALIACTLLPLYYAVHLVKSRGKRTWTGARSFFHDYILTPRATFHTREEIEAWGAGFGLELLAYDEHVGNVHAFVFRKKGGG